MYAEKYYLSGPSEAHIHMLTSWLDRRKILHIPLTILMVSHSNRLYWSHFRFQQGLGTGIQEI